MLYPVDGGTTLKLGYEYDEYQEYEVHLPPPGIVVNKLTGGLESVPILYEDKPLVERKIPAKRSNIALPTGWNEWRKEEKRMQRSDPFWIHPDAEAFRQQEWYRRLNGCWISIYNPKTKKAEPVYLTGLHYTYVFHWKLDFGLPDFRFVDLEIFYMLDLCIEDPKCNGLTLLTARRVGKTAILGLFLYDLPSRAKNIYAGLQSKTDDDATKVFNFNVIYPWRNMVDFFRPKFDYSTTQKNELTFKIPTPRGKKNEEVDIENDDSLHSYINYKDSGVYAYDGYKLHRIGIEEPGKTEKIDVYQRHRVLRPCTEVQGEIIGKMFAPTTAEELKGDAAEAFMKMFIDSQVTRKTANGKTITGLYSYFIPAYKIYKFDEYGRSLEEESKAILINERLALEDKPDDLAQLVRKYPFNAKEALSFGKGTTPFNEMILNNRLQQILAMPPNRRPYVQGDLEWIGGKDSGKLEFVRNDVNGKYLFAFIPDPEQQNKVKKDSYGRWHPLNDIRHCIATDPISVTKTVDHRMSMAAAHGFRKFDLTVDLDKPEKEWESYMYLFEYLHRPNEVEDYFEDMIKACVFLGCSILYESQKNAISTHFKNRGYAPFLMYRPETTWTNSTGNQNTEGVPASKETIDIYVQKKKTFVNRHGHRIPFPRTIESLLKFNPQKTTAFDLAVSACWTVIAAEKQVDVPLEIPNIQEWVDVFDISGTESTFIYN